jgi:PTH1 family peptidyl-tRNA hydrolase
MFIIVGLGNPGKKYDGTRHNIGFEVVDYLAKLHGIEMKKLKFKGLYGEGRIAGEKVILLKPQTFMNLSGECVRDFVSYFDLPLENLVVIYDDVDTPVGSLRIRKKGSAGSHNGMKNIIYQLKADTFPRMRIGIGAPTFEIAAYVLGRFGSDEWPEVEDAAKRAAEAVPLLIEDGVDLAMNRYNG